ncbi:hypothetical protein ScPMuIL_003069 [Solemya velum]
MAFNSFDITVKNISSNFNDVTTNQGHLSTAPPMSTTEVHDISMFSVYGVPMSARLLIGVSAFCGILVVVTFTIIIAKFVCFKERPPAVSRSLYRSTDHLATSMESMTSATFYGDEMRTRTMTSPRSPNISSKLSPDHGNYATFQNPVFKGDVQQTETFADLSVDRRVWSNDAKKTDEDRWSNASLHAVHNFDYKRYGKIPRSRTLSETAESRTSL